MSRTAPEKHPRAAPPRPADGGLEGGGCAVGGGRSVRFISDVPRSYNMSGMPHATQHPIQSTPFTRRATTAQCYQTWRGWIGICVGPDTGSAPSVAVKGITAGARQSLKWLWTLGGLTEFVWKVWYKWPEGCMHL